MDDAAMVKSIVEEAHVRDASHLARLPQPLFLKRTVKPPRSLKILEGRPVRDRDLRADFESCFIGAHVLLRLGSAAVRDVAHAGADDEGRRAGGAWRKTVAVIKNPSTTRRAVPRTHRLSRGTTQNALEPR